MKSRFGKIVAGLLTCGIFALILLPCRHQLMLPTLPNPRHRESVQKPVPQYNKWARRCRRMISHSKLGPSEPIRMTTVSCFIFFIP